ncbi:prolyl oligopeptidase family serine peptidase [Streptomyces thioluteus]|uniref:Prolyl oligopeptidase family serine peptidase n=1 Tax=Streptomyces thioluteus TaxID=66431 RepID=A0ABP6JIU6_STRTU
MTESNGALRGDGFMPDWEKRFRAPRVGLPRWAEDAPDRSLFTSNATGTFEVYAWDRATGGRRQVTDRPNGTTGGVLTPDGEWIWWFSDTDGDEFGVWMRQPFHGGPDEPAAPGLDPSYPDGLALGRDGTAVIGRSTDKAGSSVHVVRPGGAAAEIYRHEQSAVVAGLSHDGTLIAIEHTEHGDAMHSAIRVVRTDGTTVAELDDTRGGTEELGLSAMGFAPVEGDTRLLVGHQRRGRWEPMLWDATTGTETALVIDLPGDLEADWYPDGSALLVEHSYQARSELWRYDLADGALTRLDTPAGTVSGALPRPDGTVEFLWSSAEKAPVVRSHRRARGAGGAGGHGRREPRSRLGPGRGHMGGGAGRHGHTPWCRSRRARAPSRPSSTSTAAPPGTTATRSRRARRPGWTTVFAVVRVNYRGSTGYGRAWTDALKHRVGLIELEDIAAVREWAVASGLADPERLVLAGGSWGGYLTLLGLAPSRTPGRWAWPRSPGPTT